MTSINNIMVSVSVSMKLLVPTSALNLVYSNQTFKLVQKHLLI